MTQEIDYQVSIDTTERGERVFVDKFDDGVVWLSVQVRGGNARVTLTNEQAKDMIAALIRIVDSQ